MVNIEKSSTKIQKKGISGKDYLDVEIVRKQLEFQVFSVKILYFDFDTF